MEICTGIVEFVDSDRVSKAEGGKTGGVGGVGGPGVVLVQPVQVVDGQQDAQAVDEDPDDIEDIVPVWPLTVTSLLLSIYDCVKFLPGPEDRMVHPSLHQRLLPELHSGRWGPG